MNKRDKNNSYISHKRVTVSRVDPSNVPPVKETSSPLLEFGLELRTLLPELE